MTEKIIEQTEEEQEPSQEAEVEKSPYMLLVDELAYILNVQEQWTTLCTFALENLQQLYGLWLSTATAGENLGEKFNIGVKFLPPAMKQKNLVDEAARRQAVAQAEQFQKTSGLAVPPPGTILKPTKRGRRGRKQ